MGCLVEVKLRASVDEPEKLYRFFKRHRKFLEGHKVVSSEENSGQKLFRIWVPFSEDKTSLYLHDCLGPDFAVLKADLVS